MQTNYYRFPLDIILCINLVSWKVISFIFEVRPGTGQTDRQRNRQGAMHAAF